MNLYYTRLVWREGNGHRPGGYEDNERCTTTEFCTRIIMHVRCLTTELFSANVACIWNYYYYNLR